jgi:hypothetical protein
MSHYPKWESIPRLYNETFSITEKIDGTNGLIFIEPKPEVRYPLASTLILRDTYAYVSVGSRKRWITPGQDNHGFAAWVYENAEALVAALGPGHHYGEGAGPGIRGNRHGLEEKTFFLFNWRLWTHLLANPEIEIPCGLRGVAVLDIGVIYMVSAARGWADYLESVGTQAGPGSSDKPPEGVILRSDLTGQMWKYFCGGEAANKTIKQVYEHA